jgi:hypothetical protein
VSVLVVEVVAVEVLSVSVPAVARFLAGMRVLAVISVVGVIVSIDGAVEVLGTVEPWAGADEDSAGKPLWAIVAVGRAVIWRNGIVAVRACRGDANSYSDLGG